MILLYSLTVYFLSFSLTVGNADSQSNTIVAKQITDTKGGSTQSQRYDLFNSWLQVPRADDIIFYKHVQEEA